MTDSNLRCYRLIRAGDSLTMWRSDRSGRSKLISIVRCPPDAGEDETDAVVGQLYEAADVDHGTLLPWIVVDDGTDVLMTTGLVRQHR